MGKGLSFILGIVLVLAIGLNVKQCSDRDDMLNNLEIKSDLVRTYEAKNGELIEYNNSIKTDYRRLEIYNSDLSDEIRNMKIKKPDVVIRTVTTFKTDTIIKYFENQLPCDDFVEEISIDSQFYNINMTLNQDSLVINTIEIPNEQTVVVGVKKNGIFKRNEYVVAIKNTNPYITTDSLESYTFPMKKGKLIKPIVSMGFGAAIAIIAIRVFGK